MRARVLPLHPEVRRQTVPGPRRRTEARQDPSGPRRSNCDRGCPTLIFQSWQLDSLELEIKPCLVQPGFDRGFGDPEDPGDLTVRVSAEEQQHTGPLFLWQLLDGGMR